MQDVKNKYYPNKMLKAYINSIILYDFRQVGNNSPLTTERTSCLSEIISVYST